MEQQEEIKPPGNMRKSRHFLWTAMIVLTMLVAAIGVYSLRNSCDVNAVQEASARLLRQFNSYDHSYQFATSASQQAIVRPVNELQQILMDTQDVRVPLCLQIAKEELIGYMGTVIQAFLAYGAEKPDRTVRELLEQSNIHYQNFNSELDAVNQCAPLCLR